MLFFGLAEIIGGFMAGHIIHRLGNRISLFLKLPLASLTFFITIICIIDDINWDWYICCFMWGITDSFSNVLSNSILQYEFEEDIEPFSI